MSYVGKVYTGDNHSVGSTLFGECETAAGTAAKVVTLPDFDTLINGVTIYVLFYYGNTAENPTLNVNNTGAWPIYVKGVDPPGNTGITPWSDYSVVPFTLSYDDVDGAWYMSAVNADLAEAVASIKICKNIGSFSTADALEELIDDELVSMEDNTTEAIAATASANAAPFKNGVGYRGILYKGDDSYHGAIMLLSIPDEGISANPVFGRKDTSWLFYEIASCYTTTTDVDSNVLSSIGQNVSVTSVSYAEWGKMSQFEITFKALAALSSGATLGTIKSGKRPATNMTVIASGGQRCYFGTSGGITIQAALAQDATVSVRIVYLRP